ncbi:ankyrin repeat domain-containing protein [Cardinium endosymbiont of Culicoides punctatus]|uniref:ankyrin repeat domain-containing protein n=1 Tax=Cardinium endosymbiont of Culicoides punctatus TaxID=2304601 RepID=UPI0010590BDC|nr:ankyrin repeat domain-containing protein [Cardinium endosymbiont of Culicoides punctatus]TDG94784.1 hypothetical protein CCPUN_07350 [Cardinium endosymbiont of Culicoides punctatus]
MKHIFKIITFTAMVWMITGISTCTSIARNRSVKSTSMNTQLEKKQTISLSKQGIKAIQNGDMRQLEEIFNRYKDEEDKKSIANTEIRLWQDADGDSLDYMQESILYLAIYHRNIAKGKNKAKYLEIIQFLLDQGANPNVPRKKALFNLIDDYPLSKATQIRDRDVVELLLKYEYGTDVSTLDDSPEGDSSTGSALHIAMGNGDIPILEIFLAHKGINVNLPARNGRLPLQTGIINYEFRRDSNQLNAVRLLLKDKRTDINKKDSFTGDTSLCIAVEWGLTDMVEILLEQKNIYLEPKNSHGRTPLGQAVHGGRVEIVELLLNHGANPEGITPTKWSAFLSNGSQKHKRIQGLLEKAKQANVSKLNFEKRKASPDFLENEKPSKRIR